MSPLSHVQGLASGPEAGFNPPGYPSGRGRYVIFWRSPCPHVASCMGIFEEDVFEENDFFDIYEADDGAEDEFEELIEYLDNQWW